MVPEPKTDKIRAFFAISLDDSLRQECAETIKDLQSIQGGKHVSWIQPENLHITIGFVGEIGEKRLTELAGDIAKSLQQLPEFSLELKQLSPFPSLVRPNCVVRNVVKNKSLLSISKTVKNLFNTFNIKDKHPTFSPHLTLGRIKQRKWPFKKPLPEIPEETIKVQKIILYRSEKDEEGRSQYRKIVEIPLKSAP